MTHCPREPAERNAASTAVGTDTSRLARRLGTADAVVIGLGSMIGAGVFAAIGPAAQAAGAALLIATLGEEIVDPARTIPRAIPLALSITFAIYAAVAVSALAAAGPAVLAGASAPLAAAIELGRFATLSPIVSSPRSACCCR